MLASMSGIDPRADAPLVDWSVLGVSGLLPTGTVTLLLADVEGSTRLWETQPDQMADAIARLNRVVSEVVAAHGGVRPVEQGEGDSFVAAFARASDAVACALDLQRAPLAPIRLRIGVSIRVILAAAAAQFAAVADEAEAAHDEFFRADSLAMQGCVLAYQGDTAAARAVADAAVEAAAELGGLLAGLTYWALAAAALAAGDAATALDSTEAAGQHMSAPPQTAAAGRLYKAQAALAGGDLVAARRWADDAVSTTTGAFLSEALTARARVAITRGEPEQAERDAHDALARATEVQAHLFIPDILECLATLASEAGSHPEAARIFSAAEAIRARIGAVRFKIYDAGYQASVATLRNALGEQDFDAAWAEGAALSTEEAIGYAQRGRGQRKRPTSGRASLTPTERDVVRLVSEGLANNDIATRLFVSPRTVQTHLTHVYTKLGLTSRVQLVQEAARH
jgi:DNA-binding CsgD family transcriptional regulator/class 3 adenylate cyclase